MARARPQTGRRRDPARHRERRYYPDRYRASHTLVDRTTGIARVYSHAHNKVMPSQAHNSTYSHSERHAESALSRPTLRDRMSGAPGLLIDRMTFPPGHPSWVPRGRLQDRITYPGGRLVDRMTIPEAAGATPIPGQDGGDDAGEQLTAESRESDSQGQGQGEIRDHGQAIGPVADSGDADMDDLDDLDSLFLGSDMDVDVEAPLSPTTTPAIDASNVSPPPAGMANAPTGRPVNTYSGNDPVKRAFTNPLLRAILSDKPLPRERQKSKEERMELRLGHSRTMK